jgi:vacuolar iron transporter family protein
MIDHVSKKEYLAICHFQRNEITEYYIYNKLADKEPDEHKKHLLRQIANQEKVHYEFWQYYTKKDFKPYRLKVLWVYDKIPFLKRKVILL